MIYSGGRMLDMYRDIHSIPVLAKCRCHCAHDRRDPRNRMRSIIRSLLMIRMYGGADGSFTLYEDDNETNAYHERARPSTRRWPLNWEKKTFTISPGRRKAGADSERENHEGSVLWSKGFCCNGDGWRKSSSGGENLRCGIWLSYSRCFLKTAVTEEITAHYDGRRTVRGMTWKE